MHGEYSYFARGATGSRDPYARNCVATRADRAAHERLSFAPQLAPLAHADAKAPLEAVRRAHSRRVQAASAQHQRRRDHRAGSVQGHKLVGRERRHLCFGRKGRWGYARFGG
jgi:hypothetical protein